MAIFAGIVILIILYNIFIGRPKRRERDRQYARYVERRGHVVGTHAIECPRCEEEAILKIYQNDDEKIYCRHCGHEETL